MRLPLTSEPLATLADEAVELVDAGAGILAGAGRAVVAVLVAVLADPAGLAVAAVATKQKKKPTADHNRSGGTPARRL